MDAAKIAIDIAETVIANTYMRSLGPEFLRDVRRIVRDAAIEVLTDPNVAVEFYRDHMQQQEEHSE